MGVFSFLNRDNRKKLKSLISSHTDNKSNPHGITPEQVGALKIYTNLSELGLNELTATAQNIVEAMDNNSILLHGCSEKATSAVLAFPFNYGLLQVIKRNNSYSDFEYNIVNQKYYGYYNGGSSGAKWSGWSTHFLPLTGGTLRGSLAVQKSSIPEYILKAAKSMSKISKNASETVEGGLLIIDYADTTDASNYVSINLNHSEALRNMNRLLRVISCKDGTGTDYNIFGEHNKPTGTYIGNGDATKRTIDINGIGVMLFITSVKGSAIITNTGGFLCNNSNISMASPTLGNYSKNTGVLTLTTDNVALNASGVTYSYSNI